MHGIVPLWKPKGFTSHDCVSKARGMLKTKKIGHTGTLDPNVEGVLPLCVGKATKIVPFLTETEKVYEATVTLGFSTETEDAYGEIVTQAEVNQPIDMEQVKQVIERFTGEITQIPPMYSAVRVDGKRLYEYAREGIEVDRPSRQVLIKDIEIMNEQIDYDGQSASFSIKVVCSKGTYIRTLCVDIGEALGYPAHMSNLVRTQTSDITKQDCKTFAEIQEVVDNGNVENLLLPIARGLSHLETWHVDVQTKPLIQHGRVLSHPPNIEADQFAVMCNDEAIAIYQNHPTKPGYIKPVRVF